MAKRKSKTRSTSSRGKAARGRSRKAMPAKSQDAIALLKADHRQVEGWFEEFDSSRSDSRKQDLAAKICAALKAHTTIEEEIFYPAFLEATGEEDIHHEAEVEHDGARKLIAEIEKAGPDDDYFDARVSVLSEMIKHHVREEEGRDGMFAKARAADMDLQALGQQLATRKAEVMGEAGEDGEEESARSRRPAADSGERGVLARALRRVRGE
jgi:hemerythrin superfamily protein